MLMWVRQYDWDWHARHTDSQKGRILLLSVWVITFGRDFPFLRERTTSLYKKEPSCFKLAQFQTAAQFKQNKKIYILLSPKKPQKLPNSKKSSEHHNKQTKNGDWCTLHFHVFLKANEPPGSLCQDAARANSVSASFWDQTRSDWIPPPGETDNNPLCMFGHTYSKNNSWQIVQFHWCTVADEPLLLPGESDSFFSDNSPCTNYAPIHTGARILCPTKNKNVAQNIHKKNHIWREIKRRLDTNGYMKEFWVFGLLPSHPVESNSIVILVSTQTKAWRQKADVSS